MDDIYKNIEDYNPNKKRKILIIFDDMIADMLINKKLKKTKHFSCFYYTILFHCPKKCYTKFNRLFSYKNSKQKKTSTNCV